MGDIVDGIENVLFHQEVCDGEIINFGTETEHTTLEGIETVETTLNTQIKLKRLDYKRSGDQVHTCVVITKARKLLGYNPTTTLKEGLKH